MQQVMQRRTVPGSDDDAVVDDVMRKKEDYVFCDWNFDAEDDPRLQLCFLVDAQVVLVWVMIPRRAPRSSPVPSTI